MAWNMYDTHTLMELMRHTEAPSDFFKSRYFGSTQLFDTEYIDFEKVSKGRKLAPFVSPMARGKVLKDQGSSMIRFKPAYVKPKHALDPGKVIKRRAGEAIGGSSNPVARRDAILMDYMQDHREIIARREEWLAAKAVLDGKVTIASDDYPAVEVDFGRDAANTVTLTGTALWSDAGITQDDVIGNINTWVNQIRRAKFGGPVTDMIVSPKVYGVMQPILKELLNVSYRGSNDTLNRSVLDGSVAQVVGQLGGFLNVIVYQDWYEDDTGTAQAFMGDNDLLLVGPNVGGVRAYGAIMDDDSNYQAQEIFTKMWKEQDPSGVFVMSQSAPLMIPVNPNNTLKATVVA